MFLPPLLPRLSSTTGVVAHAMTETAEAHGHVVAAATIVRNQQVPGHFLDQLLGKLRRAGLLRSMRGAHGGHALTRAVTSIFLADIIDAGVRANGADPCSMACADVRVYWLRAG